MSDINIIDKKNKQLDSKLEPVEYAKKTFSMFGGEEESIEVLFNENLIGVLIDRFGKDIIVLKRDDGLKTRINAKISPSFFAWVFRLGNQVKIISPKNIAKRYKDYLKETLNNYLE